jgi:hypothetical protein
MQKSFLLICSLLLIFSVIPTSHADAPTQTPQAPAITQNRTVTGELFDIIFFAAYGYLCEKYGINLMHAEIHEVEWDSSFSSTTHHTGIVERIKRLLGMSTKKPTFTVSSTTTINELHDIPHAFKHALIQHASTTHNASIAQCTRQSHEDGTITIKCTATLDLEEFQKRMASLKI